MKGFMCSTLLLCALIYTGSTSRARGSTRRSLARQENTPINDESPKLFDEFLLTIVESGRIPTEYNTVNSYSAANTTSMPLPQANSTRSSLRSSMRRHHRGQGLAEIRRRLEEERKQGNLQQTRNNSQSGAASARSVASGIREQDRRRSHSRRDADTEMYNQMREAVRGMSSENLPCCFLGQTAGDKGFYCQADFYAERLLNRFPNRVHNREMTSYFNNGRTTETGMNMLQSFNRCVTTPHEAAEFTRCCFQTTQMQADILSRSRRFVEALGGA